MRILFAASEAHPLVKTGGLGDVAGSLPRALAAMGHDVRLVLPGYRAVRRHTTAAPEPAGAIAAAGGRAATPLLATTVDDGRVPVYLVDTPELFDRDGGPYVAPDGRSWPDNPARFAHFSRCAAAVAVDQAGLQWQPDVVHCHDWQTGLVCPFLATVPQRPATVFTIHNMAYQGVYSRDVFDTLGLPADWWHLDGLEFHGGFSFMKGGLAFADRLTTVSPTYAGEICTPEYGYGLEGLLQGRRDDLVGILNGVDYAVWDPAHDPCIEAPYSATNAADGKARNKTALQRRLGLPVDPDAPLVAHIGRLVEQKGIDLLLDTLPALLPEGVQLAVLGAGETRFEAALSRTAAAYPASVAAYVGFNETLAHQLEAGADIFAMPSRFEPCGLNQIYSLRYGTVPVVRRTGGLADTVVDASPQAVADGTATGFAFDAPEAAALSDALGRALAMRRDTPDEWHALMQRGMAQDFSWSRSARAYIEVYDAVRRI